MALLADAQITKEGSRKHSKKNHREETGGKQARERMRVERKVKETREGSRQIEN